MNIHSILFPTDYSHYNDAALEYALTLAVESGATLHIVHVHDVRDLSTVAGEPSSLYASAWQEGLEEARKLLEKIVPARDGVDCKHHCVIGTPEEEIVSFASENECELIVMASHGRTGLSRLLMGSVAEGVMRNAPCPVLIVKQPVTKLDTSPNSATSGATLGIFS
jgi:nucleotide-binding universal stress UspA family protein